MQIDITPVVASSSRLFGTNSVNFHQSLSQRHYVRIEDKYHLDSKNMIVFNINHQLTPIYIKQTRPSCLKFAS